VPWTVRFIDLLKAKKIPRPDFGIETQKRLSFCQDTLGTGAATAVLQQQHASQPVDRSGPVPDASRAGQGGSSLSVREICALWHAL
jgi:hypothetical protein